MRPPVAVAPDANFSGLYPAKGRGFLEEVLAVRRLKKFESGLRAVSYFYQRSTSLHSLTFGLPLARA